jgi:cell wall-associated NlpC family hydrolase
MSARSLLIAAVSLFVPVVAVACAGPVSPAASLPTAPLTSAALTQAAASLAVGQAATPPPAAAPSSRWIAVSVATLWVKPRLARPIDAPACANPADPRRWVKGMTVSQKRWLVGKLETQALYGTRVYVLGASGAWSKVAVAGQPTPRNTLGYPGWLPTAQLTKDKPKATVYQAIVRRATVWAYAAPDWSSRVVELSYATRLPAVSWTAAYVGVAMLDGRRLYVRRAEVALHRAAAVWPKPAGAAVVVEARRFLGLQYLWAGTSGFGYDCSGFTCSLFSALGETIARDAGDQFAVGTKVSSRASLRPGDLVFFRNSSGQIHHVGMYIGAGKMIHAPATGRAVSIVSLSSEPYSSEFAGGRRYTH